jgi:glycosyltransferase involved in cell wall biosynthesis
MSDHAGAAPSVSILIPALRPNWLDTAIASALAQTHADFELLVSDDSPGRDIESVVAKWSDPRIRYLRNPRRGQPGANRDHLLAHARGEYLKFLFDDDYLMPRSVELLLAACRDTGAPMAFHARHVVDENGVVIESKSLVPTGQTTLVSPAFFFEHMVGRCVNLVGEPSNTLLHAPSLAQLPQPFALGSRRMRFLTDMALFANLGALGPGFAAVGYFGSAFRRHAAQASSQHRPVNSAAYFEWDLLRRWSVDAGMLPRVQYDAGLPQMRAMYGQARPHFPELQPFVNLLHEGLRADDSALDARFAEALTLAYAAIEVRKLAIAATARTGKPS